MPLPVIVGVLLALSAPAALAGQTSPAPAGDEAAVREVVRRYVNARELRDPKAIEALFTADADQHTTSGEWRRGRAQVCTRHARIVDAKSRQPQYRDRRCPLHHTRRGHRRRTL